MRAARELMERALFSRRCDGLDPSLASVLAGRPLWSPGRPWIADSYAVFLERSPRPGFDGAVWVTYGSHNHRRDGDGGTRGSLRTAARRGSLEVMTTAHGVAVFDRARHRHAWIYVTEVSPLKLRHRSVERTRLRGDHVHVDLIDQQLRIAIPRGD
jgi:hypothetical protein